MMLNMKSRAYRERHESCLLEGKFLIADAMKSGMFVRLVYFSRLQNLIGLPIDILRKTNLTKVSFKEIQQASEVKVQSQGLIAVATKQDEITRKKLVAHRQEQIEKNKEFTMPVTLICDNIRDAGNMGTLIRTAAAVGCEQVITTKGCVDIWDSKVIRSGAGAHFKIPIEPSLDWEEIIEKFENLDIRNVYLSHPGSKTLKMKDIVPNFNSGNILHKTLTSSVEGTETFQDDDDITDRINDVTLCALPYYDIPFVETGHTVIVLGSETQGLGPKAYSFAIETALKNEPTVKKLYNLVNIPMSFGSECLNTSVAGSILLYEARRQISDA